MAKQTINIGASPNDGTGTPLRTSFDYCNQNFTELYTATGPSGNNIVVPGSATITGDLTVDTSTLKVDSANNRVGINTATPVAGVALQVCDNVFGPSLSSGIRFGNSGNNYYYDQLIVTDGSSNPAYQLNFATHTLAKYLYGGGGNKWEWYTNNTLAMTLNATGLGVGTSPLYKLHAVVTSGAVGAFRASTAAIARLLVGNTVEDVELKVNANGDGQLTAGASKYLGLGSGGLNDRVILDTAGNCGIGVTPSAWLTGVKALDIGSSGLAAYSGGITHNAYFDNTDSRWEYKGTGAATFYNPQNGIHQWFVAASGIANNPITTFANAAMTLDASGNLLVGKTATGFGTVGNEVKANGEVFSTQASTSNVASTYHVYSTGAAAYRFYVGMGGTVFATNTTISAISDARFKENVQDIDVGLSAILALKPRKFDWKAGKGKDIKGDRGFIAQEFETVFPNLIDEWKENAPEGEAPYKSVRQDLIPVLVKAIQELTARVQNLETR
jgi:hypothetical protein